MKRRMFVGAALAATSAAGPSALGIAAEPASQPATRLPIGFLGVGHSHAAGKIKVVQCGKLPAAKGERRPGPCQVYCGYSLTSVRSPLIKRSMPSEAVSKRSGP